MRLALSKVMILAEKQDKHATAVLVRPFSASVCQRASHGPAWLELAAAAVEVFKLERATWSFPFSFKSQAAVSPGMPPLGAGTGMEGVSAKPNSLI